jgi:hypothetical protein
MAINATILALDCVRPCDTLRELDDAQFFSLLIERLAQASGTSIASITGAQLTDEITNDLCYELAETTTLPQASPMVLKAVALYLASQL